MAREKSKATSASAPLVVACPVQRVGQWAPSEYGLLRQITKFTSIEVTQCPKGARFVMFARDGVPELQVHLDAAAAGHLAKLLAR